MMWPRHKFHAIRTELDGIKFPSKLEARCYEDLKRRKLSGEVLGFLRQVPIHFTSGIKYIVDFLVFNVDGTCRFLEAKGFETATYKLKRRMMAQEYPWIPLEVYR